MEPIERCRTILQEEWQVCDHLARSEMWSDLYYRRFGCLAPGKSDPIADSNSPENRTLCKAWHSSGLAAHDAIQEVIRLLAEVERLTRERDALRGALDGVAAGMRDVVYMIQSDTHEPTVFDKLNTLIARAEEASRG